MGDIIVAGILFTGTLAAVVYAALRAKSGGQR